MTRLVSLIVCTTGRANALARLLNSLRIQSSNAFEVIVVDQSESEDIQKVLETCSASFTIHHFRSKRGLSRARNVGLRHARGHVVGFPDDDCWYGNHVIDQVQRFFQVSDSEVLTGRTVDSDGKDSVNLNRTYSGPIDRENVFESGNSNTLFVRTVIAKDVGGFDETLGLGALTPFQSGEETDFMLRCLSKSYGLYYDHDFIVYHDQINASADAQVARTQAYSRGYGRLLRIHDYGIGHLGMRVVRATVNGTIRLASGDGKGARQRYSWASGSLRGFLAPVRRSERSH